MSEYSEKIIEKKPYIDLREYDPVLFKTADLFNKKLNGVFFSGRGDNNDALTKFISESTSQIMLGRDVGSTSRLGDNMILFNDLLWIQENKSVENIKKDEGINMGKQLLSSFKKIDKTKVKEIVVAIEKKYPEHAKRLTKESNNFEVDIEIPKIYVIFNLSHSIQKMRGDIQILSHYVVKKIWADEHLSYAWTYKTRLYYASINPADLHLFKMKNHDYTLPDENERDRGPVLAKLILEENGIKTVRSTKQEKGFDLIDDLKNKYEVKGYVYSGSNIPLQFESNNPLKNNTKYVVMLLDHSLKNSDIFHVFYAGILDFKKIEDKVKYRFTYRRWFKFNH